MSDQSWTIPTTFEPLSDEVRDLLFPPDPHPHGVVESDWSCKWCDVKITMRCPVDRIEDLPGKTRIYATVENADELRAHVRVVHGIDPGDTPLTIMVEVKR